jgi:hypothetical protein
MASNRETKRQVRYVGSDGRQHAHNVRTGRSESVREGHRHRCLPRPVGEP